jgi:GT2 family glycosyltransferase
MHHLIDFAHSLFGEKLLHRNNLRQTVGLKCHMSNPISAPMVTLSIVSHGHGDMLPGLLKDIERTIDTAYELILTFNIAEDERFLQDFPRIPIKILRNSRPLGFGQNHNQAFRYCKSPVFVIVNPDIRAQPFALKPLIEALSQDQTGASGPQIVSNEGITQDSARYFPTLRSLLSRRLANNPLDYLPTQRNQIVDWLAGMLVAFKSDAYRAVAGFDEKYFMYVEDVDIARRLQAAGYTSVWVPSLKFIHDAQHSSRKNLTHLWWHLRSMARYLLSSI